MAETREPQYQNCLDVLREHGRATFGLMTNQAWYDDPKRLAFTLSRYKFVSKMLAGQGKVLEVGCADAFATRVVVQAVGHLTAVDFDPVFVKDVNDRMDSKWKFDCRVHDMLQGPVREGADAGPFDAAYAMDVLEHISPETEDAFLRNMTRSLSPRGTLIVGMPSIHSQAYASPPSKAGHVNCKDERGLRESVGRFFHNVFVFSMNDEVVHTGYTPMAQYLIALCCGPK